VGVCLVFSVGAQTQVYFALKVTNDVWQILISSKHESLSKQNHKTHPLN